MRVTIQNAQIDAVSNPVLQAHATHVETNLREQDRGYPSEKVYNNVKCGLEQDAKIFH